MAPIDVLNNPSSRRRVLQTGAKVAYATPIVLASMKAVPAFAQNPDISEDNIADRNLADALNTLAAGLTLTISGGTVTVNSYTKTDVAAALPGLVSALNAYLTDFNTLLSDVQGIVPGSNTLTMTGSVTLPNGTSVDSTTSVSSAITALQASNQMLNDDIVTLNTDFNNPATPTATITADLQALANLGVFNSGTNPYTTGSVETVENILVTMAYGQP